MEKEKIDYSDEEDYDDDDYDDDYDEDYDDEYDQYDYMFMLAY